MAISSIGGRSQTAAGGASTAASLVRAGAPFSSYLQAASAGNAPGQGQTPAAGTSLDRLLNLAHADTPNINAADLKRAAESGLSEFRRTLGQLFDEAGVDRSQEIRLESDGYGGVVVAGDHPDADKIEDLFKENPDLAAKFQSLANAYRKLQAAEARSDDEEGMFRPTFGLTILGDEMKAAFK